MEHVRRFSTIRIFIWDLHGRRRRGVVAVVENAKKNSTMSKPKNSQDGLPYT